MMFKKLVSTVQCWFWKYNAEKLSAACKQASAPSDTRSHHSCLRRVKTIGPKERPSQLDTRRERSIKTPSQPTTMNIITRSLLIRQAPRFLTTVTTQATPESEPTPDHLYRYLKIKCSGHELEVLDSYETFLKLAAENLDIQYVATETPFRTIKRRTLLASRFVKKKYRVQYEFRSYYRDVLFKNLTGSTADTFLEYIERNLPEGVLMIVEKHRLAELPFELNNAKETNNDTKVEEK